MAYETSSNRTAEAHVSPAFDVAEKLRPHLANLMGDGGFRALLSRALVLAKAEVSWLRAVQVNADGKLVGLERAQFQIDQVEFLEGAGILVAQLLGLLVAFIGLTLTLRQISEVWPGFNPAARVVDGEEVQSGNAD